MGWDEPICAIDGNHDFHAARARRMNMDSSTMAFFEQYIAELFRPFAEHVADQVAQLHKSVETLTGDFRETNQIARVALEKHFPENNVNHALIVSELQKQLQNTRSHVDMLQHSHDRTNATMAEMSARLQEAKKELQSLNAAQEATTEMLTGTKQFANDLQEEFKTSLKRFDEIHDRHRNQFTRVDTRLIDMSEMLTQTVTRVNHLRAQVHEAHKDAQLQNEVGIQPATEISPQFQTPEITTKAKSKRAHTAGGGGGALVGAMGPVMGVGLKTRLDHLETIVFDTKHALELNQEWWKGLSHGFRETYRSVSIDKEMLPTRPGTALSTRPGTALSMASMATTQSGGPSRPMSARPISARPSRDLSHREPRDRRIHLASLDATPTW
mmetsp:Transcript_92596/g.178603  ORF Transcript_92596/g.178603 Transcript_92596/m.178603 type:complete len:384 (+) Transcript_92596:26-1177(+)